MNPQFLVRRTEGKEMEKAGHKVMSSCTMNMIVCWIKTIINSNKLVCIKNANMSIEFQHAHSMQKHLD